jgi:hypothetical protein
MADLFLVVLAGGLCLWDLFRPKPFCDEERPVTGRPAQLPFSGWFVLAVAIMMYENLR